MAQGDLIEREGCGGGGGGGQFARERAFFCIQYTSGRGGCLLSLASARKAQLAPGESNKSPRFPPLRAAQKPTGRPSTAHR